MQVEVSTYTVGQAFTIDRYRRFASLFDQFDTSLRAGKEHIFTASPYTREQYRTWDTDTPFALRFNATGVWGLWKIRDGYRKQMDRMGLTKEANDIESDIAHKRRDAELRAHIVHTGGE